MNTAVLFKRGTTRVVATVAILVGLLMVAPAANAGKTKHVARTGTLDHFRVAIPAAQKYTDTGFVVTVTALDSANRTVTNFAGAINAVDVTGSLYAIQPFVWANGVATATLAVAQPSRNNTIVVSGNSATGTSNVFTVVGLVDHFKVSLDSPNVSVGAPVALTAVAYDPLNQVVSNLTGPLAVPSVIATDLSNSIMPVTPFNWVSGTGSATVAFMQPFKNNTVTVAAAGAAGTSSPFIVYGFVDHFRVTVSDSPVAQNTPLTLTAVALDVLNQQVLNLNGQVGPNVNVTDRSGHLMPGTPFAWAKGVGTATLQIAVPFKDDRLTVAGSGAVGVSPSFDVIGQAVGLKFSAITTPLTAGVAAPVTVTAVDSLGQTAMFSPASTITVSSGEVFTSTVAERSGVARVSILVPAPAHAIQFTARAAAPLGSGNLTGTSATVDVIGPLAKLKVTLAAATVRVSGLRGGTLGVTVTAQDALGQTVQSFAGPVAITDTTGTVSTAVPFVWTAGVGKGALQFGTPYKGDVITVSDGGGAVKPARSTAFDVIGVVDRFAVTLSSPTTLNTTVTVTVRAYDALGQSVQDYVGPITLSDTPNGIVVVTPVSFAGGVGTGQVKFTIKAAGNRVTATDNSGLAVPPTGRSVAFDVR